MPKFHVTIDETVIVRRTFIIEADSRVEAIKQGYAKAQDWPDRLDVVDRQLFGQGVFSHVRTVRDDEFVDRPDYERR